MAGHFTPSGVSPSFWKTWSSWRDLVPGLFQVALETLRQIPLVALSINFGSDFTIWFSA